MKKIVLVVGIILTIVMISIFMFLSFLSKIPGRPAEKFTPSELTEEEINTVMSELLNTDTDVLCEFLHQTQKVSLESIALVPDSIEFASENAKKLNNAISEAKKGTTLIIPSGRYYIDCALQLFNKENIHITLHL